MKIGRGFLFFLLLLFLTARAVFCYDNLIIHPRLSTKAIEVYNQESDNKITQEESTWIIHGSIAEDTDPRYLNHFYNPKTGLGLHYFIQHASAKQWANNQMSATGDYDISTILDNYRDGNRERAWQGVGHILHLIQDMSVPAHVRVDEHRKGDPFEVWLKTKGTLPSLEYKKYRVNDINLVFDNLAELTYDNFFSKDTIERSSIDLNNLEEEKIDGEKVYYVFGYYRDKKFRRVYVKNPDSINPIYQIDDEKVHQDYWNILAPQAIGYSAGTLEWFKNEFTKIDEEKADLSLINKLKSLLVAKIWGFSRGMNYVYGDMYLPGQVLREDDLKEVIEQINSSQFVQNSAKAVVKLDEILDSASEGVKGAIEQIKVLGEEFVYQESEASAEELTEPNSSVADSGEVVELERVIDGDTIVLKNGDRVRYIGIDAPELNGAGKDDDECLAWVAKVRNEQLLRTGEINLVKDPDVDKDKYGRLLRYIYVGDNFINATLAREGLAEVFFCRVGWENCPVTTDQERQTMIEEANELAQINKRGIYSQVCQEDEKIVLEEKMSSAVETEKEETILKPENFIIFHSSGEILTENLDNQNQSNQDTSLAVSFFNLYDLNTLSQEYTASTTVGINLGIQNEDLAETFCLSEDENYPEFTDPCWKGGVGESYELSSGDGLKKVYLFIRQGEEVIKSYATIYLDTESLQIYFIESPSIYASSTDAVFVVGANKDVVGEYSLDNASSTFANLGEEILFNNLEEGEHNFYFEGVSLNNEIASTSFDWLIDLTAPTISLDVSQVDEDFNLSWLGEDLSLASSSAGIDFYNLFYQLASTSPWEIILDNTEATSTTFSLASSSEETVFGVEAVDRAGNKSDLSLASSSLEIDETCNHIVISEVQLASGESSKDEFVELYNPTEAEINLFGYRLSRKTKSGNETNLLTEFPEVIIPSTGYYLVAHEDYDGVNPVDSVYSTSQSIADDNTIILYSDAGETVVDKLGVGEASDFEGEVFSSNPQKGFSLERKALASSTLESISEDKEGFGNSYDSDNNAEDFIMQSEPNPRGLNLAPVPKVLTDNLEHLWHFDECIGYEAYDMIKSGVFSDNFGWSEGVWGCSSSLRKTGVSSETEISLLASDGISLSFFLKTGRGLESVSLFNEELNKEIKIGLMGGSLILFDGENSQNLGYQADTNWHNYSLTLNEKTVRIFIDGVFENEFNLEQEFNNFSTLKIGEIGNINLDELAIWSRVLADEEILEIFNRTEMLEPTSNYSDKKLYEWKSGEATSTVMTELVQGDDLEIGEAEWAYDETAKKYFLNIASTSPLEKELMMPVTQENFSINYFFGHSAMGKNIDNSLFLSSSAGLFGFRLYDKKIDVYSNGEIYTFDCNYSAGLLSLVFNSEENKFYIYANARLLGEGDYSYQNHEITSFQISAEEDNYMFYSLSIWDGVLTSNQITGQMMNL